MRAEDAIVAIDPATIAQGIAALKTAFDSVRSAIGMVRDVQSLGGGSEKEKQAIDNALTIASSNAAIAEAQLAQAFGYEMCKCRFPPVPMKTVGYFNVRTGNNNEGDPVYECPECATAMPGHSGTPDLHLSVPLRLLPLNPNPANRLATSVRSAVS
jgi:hypothetical protein